MLLDAKGRPILPLPEKLDALKACLAQNAKEDSLGHLFDLLWLLMPGYEGSIGETYFRDINELCNRYGKVGTPILATCSRCDGKGRTYWESRRGPEQKLVGSGSLRCSHCLGTGQWPPPIPIAVCSVCDAEAASEKDQAVIDRGQGLGDYVCRGPDRGEDYYYHDWKPVTAEQAKSLLATGKYRSRLPEDDAT